MDVDENELEDPNDTTVALIPPSTSSSSSGLDIHVLPTVCLPIRAKLEHRRTETYLPPRTSLSPPSAMHFSRSPRLGLKLGVLCAQTPPHISFLGAGGVQAVSTRRHMHATKHLIRSSCTTMPTKPQSVSLPHLAVHLRMKKAKTQTLTTRTIMMTELHDRDAQRRGARDERPRKERCEEGKGYRHRDRVGKAGKNKRKGA